jgi:quercetin dioxygenase-like cupin family protein
MATLKDVLRDLETATNPVAKVIHKGSHFKVLALGFNKGMLLKEHQAHVPSKLTVINGAVIYREKEKEQQLSQYDELDIPVGISHSVEALDDSLCILTQG